MEENAISERLASALNRRDEVPNIELAKELVQTRNKQHIDELVTNLSGRKNLQNDSIKVLYEVGGVSPDLIKGHLETFISLLPTKNNRLQWGLMTAINCLVADDPDAIYNHLPILLKTSDAGSVITKDQMVHLLIKLCKIERYKHDAFRLLNEQLLKSATNQLPMYAELAMEIVDESNRTLLLRTLQSRLYEMDKASKRKRIEKVLKKLS